MSKEQNGGTETTLKGVLVPTTQIENNESDLINLDFNNFNTVTPPVEPTLEGEEELDDLAKYMVRDAELASSIQFFDKQEDKKVSGEEESTIDNPVVLGFKKVHRRAVITEINKRVMLLEKGDITADNVLEYYILCDFRVFLKKRNKQRVFIYLSTMEEYANTEFRKSMYKSAVQGSQPLVRPSDFKEFEDKKLELLTGYLNNLLQQISKEKSVLVSNQNSFINLPTQDNAGIYAVMKLLIDNQKEGLETLDTLASNISTLIQFNNYIMDNE